ncbi:hypothetical protein N7451_007536 [Penicillium sp. IBT 35674x]|nr:hypothetical protein N7451_007536 [Penicillium sp. IBT 35674x]
MVCIPQTLIDPVWKSTSQANADTWLMGPLRSRRSLHLYRHHRTYRMPASLSLPADDPKIKLVYDTADCSAAWSTGNSAFCKVRISVPGTTAEAIALDCVHKQKPGTLLLRMSQRLVILVSLIGKLRASFLEGFGRSFE